MHRVEQLKKGRKVTIRDIARDAGVSTSAVSKVLTDAYGVSDAMRMRVQGAIDKLGYRPSTVARGMRGSTYSVGLLLVEIENPFMAELVRGIRTVLDSAGYKMLMGVGEARAQIELSLIDSMMDLSLDGLILIAPGMAPEALTRLAGQIPVTVLGHHDPATTLFDTVNGDDVAGAGQAVAALVAGGHRDIHMLSIPARPDRTDVFCLREDGYLAAMDRAGLAAHARIRHLPGRHVEDDAVWQQILTAPDRPSAFFCWSDVHALQLLDHAIRLGLNVPRDLSIVGYDNSALARMPMIGLSSIDQQGPAQGEAAARTLLSRLKGRTGAEHHLLTPALMARRSSGAGPHG